ncbi:MAG TPA: GAF domain-containing protein [Parafilimonas sp.]|nr:GAF domain-containing protein [Parafilimonas sp.]
MKNLIINFSERSPIAGLLKAELSFQPFVDFIENKRANDTTVKKEMLRFVQDGLKKFPSLNQPVPNDQLDNYKELLELIYAALTGITTEQGEIFWALGMPASMTIFYGTDALYNLLLDKNGKAIKADISKEISESDSRKIIMLYSIILQRFYEYTLPLKNEVIHYFIDPETGLSKYYKVNFDDRFINIILKQKLPALNFRKIEQHSSRPALVEYLQKVLPLDAFTYEGFNVISLADVTIEYSIESIKNSITETSVKPKEVCVADVKRSLKTLVGCNTIEFGFIPFVEMNKRPLLDFGSLSNSVLLHYGRNGTIPEATFLSMVNDFIKNPVPIFLKDLGRYKNSSNSLITMLKASGNAAFALIPLFYNGLLTAVLEVYSAEAGKLDEKKLLKLHEALPYLAQLLKTSVDDFHHKIANIVNAKFTALQPSVRWKFNEAAWHYMYNGFLQKKEPELESIRFEKVYPLFGAIDIRNSSVERNMATREDLYYNLSLLIETFTKIKGNYKLDLIDEMIFKSKKWLNTVSESLTPQEEYRLNNFLENEALVALRHVKKIQPVTAGSIDEYLESLDDKTGETHKNRRNLETSMQMINKTIIDYLDEAKNDLQVSYPYYFEKFRTDGVEYDIYIGQSISPDISFDVLYLKNLRLWQLKSMAAIYKKVKGLELQMPRRLFITQLIFINAEPIDIAFRNDEKRFDVDGAYNIRYQVIKKRIDKVHLKDSEERLTQPGKIALVYFNKEDAEDYISYINFLQEQDVLENDLEYLDLEELQGVSGLKALRVGINLD